MACRSRRQFSHLKQGRRDDIGPQHFKSKMEANFARYLKFLVACGTIKSWEYETETFWFENIKRGVRSYTPDFRVIENDGRTFFYEVKGYMDPKSRTKLKRMKKYHPDVEIKVIDDKFYRSLFKWSRMIEGWE